MSNDEKLRELRRRLGVAGDDTAAGKAAPQAEAGAADGARATGEGKPRTQTQLPPPRPGAAAAHQTLKGIGTPDGSRPAPPTAGDDDEDLALADDDYEIDSSVELEMGDLLDYDTAVGQGSNAAQAAPAPAAVVPAAPALAAAAPALAPAEAPVRAEPVPVDVDDLPPADPSPSVTDDPDTAQQERDFFLKEATAAAERQPQRGALMWLAAAACAERAGVDASITLSHLDAALALNPDSPHLLGTIRRAMVRLGAHDRALELTQRELEAGGEKAHRAALLLEAGAIATYHGSDTPQALTYLTRSLEAQPANVPALALLAELQRQSGRPAERAAVLDQLAQTLTAPRERAELLYEIGSLQEFQLDQADAAAATYSRAIDDDPDNLPAVMALCVLLEQGGQQTAELCQRLEQWAQLVNEPRLESRLLMRAGLLHFERLGNLDGATRCFNGAARAEPFDRAALRRLAELYAASDSPAELAATLQQQLKHTLDGRGRAALLCQLGALCRGRLDSIEDAVRFYQQALQAVPAYAPAVEALGTIYRQRRQHEPLATLLASEVESSSTVAGRVDRSLELARLLIEKLDRPGLAIDTFRRAIELDPRAHAAYWGLARALRDQGRHAELAQILEKQVEATQDPKSRHHVLLELALVQAGPLQDSARAVQALSAARELAVTRGPAVELATLLQRSGRHAELVALLMDEAVDTADEAESEALQLRAARVLEHPLEERERALEIYGAILKRNPRSAAASRAAARLYFRLGRWSDLIDLHQRELANTEPAEAALLWCRIAEIYDRRLGQPASAIDAYLRALETDGSCAPAVAALERLLRAAERWQDMLTMLRRFAGARGEPLAKADALCRAAEIAELQLDNGELAAQLLSEAGAAAPAATEPPHGLLRLQLRQRDYPAIAALLSELIDSSKGDLKAQLQLLLARVREHRLGEAPDLDLYQQAAKGSSIGKRLGIEVMRVRRSRNDPELAQRLHERGKLCADPQLATAYLLEAAHRIEFSGAEGAALDACKDAYARRPENPAVGWALERALWRDAAHGGLARLYEGEAQQQLEATHKCQLLSDAAAAYLRSGRPAEAARTAQACLRLLPQWLPALTLLLRLAEARDDRATVAALSDSIAHASLHPTNRLAASLRAADLWSNALGDEAHALASLKTALETAPGESAAFEQAEQLLRRRAEFGELARLYDARIKAAGARDERLDLLRRYARLLQQDIGDATSAIAALKELLAADPADHGALGDLAALLVAQQRWAEAADTFGALIKHSSDAQEQLAARLQQAEIWLRRLNEPNRARDVLLKVLQSHAGNIEARKLLVELALDDGAWDEARSLLEALATEQEPQLKAWALLQLSDVATVGLRDDELRRRSEIAALTAAANVPEALQIMVERFRDKNELPRLRRLGESVIRTTTHADALQPLRVLVARLLLEENSELDRALQLLRESLVTSPDNPEIQLLFAQALESNAEFEAAVSAYRKVLESNAQSMPAYRGLARAFGRLDRPELAATASAVLDLFEIAEADEAIQSRTLEDTVLPPGRYDIGAFQLPPDLRRLAALLEPAVAHLGSLFGSAGPTALDPGHPTASACTRVAAALGLDELDVSIGGSDTVSAAVGQPPQLRVAEPLAEPPTDPRFRFWVARALCTLSTPGALLSKLADPELDQLVEALCTPRPADPETAQLRKQINRALPRKLRKQLEAEGIPARSAALWGQYRAFEQRRADLVGLIFCRSPKVAVSELARVENLHGRLEENPRLEALLRFSVSDEFARGQQQLWRTRV